MQIRYGERDVVIHDACEIARLAVLEIQDQLLYPGPPPSDAFTQKKMIDTITRRVAKVLMRRLLDDGCAVFIPDAERGDEE